MRQNERLFLSKGPWKAERTVTIYSELNVRDQCSTEMASKNLYTTLSSPSCPGPHELSLRLGRFLPGKLTRGRSKVSPKALRLSALLLLIPYWSSSCTGLRRQCKKVCLRSHTIVEPAGGTRNELRDTHASSATLMMQQCLKEKTMPTTGLQPVLCHLCCLPY